MEISTMNLQDLCSSFDHTLLKAFADENGFVKLCKEAAENKFAMVAINSGPVALCKKLLEGTGVHVGAAVGFPLGQTAIAVKAFETETAIKDGADEIDYVINIGELKNGNDSYIKEEMKTIVGICRMHQVISKVIFENCYLEKAQIRRVAGIAREIRPDYVKTSTGFGTSGATAEDVRLMKDTAGDGIKVKAAGGIRDWATCRAMIEAGAERIGTSSSFQIMEEFRRR